MAVLTFNWSNFGVCGCFHDDIIKWKHFPFYWTFVRGIHRSPDTSPHKGQWRGALMFSLICAWTNGWGSGDLRRHCAHYDVTVMTDKHNIRHIAPWRPCRWYLNNLKSTEGTFVCDVDLLEMAWHQPQTNILTLMQLLRLVFWTKNTIVNVRN